jgi:hypothetical protein
MTSQHETKAYDASNHRVWRVYTCARCGGTTVAAARKWDTETIEIYPSPLEVESALPARAREYLEQAVNSMHAPAGAVMLAASSVDAMLKAKGYKEGSLYSRIDKAAKDHVITSEMAAWAHEVRLDANDQRHADEGAALPTGDDARRVVEFTSALGQFLFVLPSRVQRGLEAAKSSTS